MNTTKTTTVLAATLILSATLIPAVHAAAADAPSIVIHYDANGTRTEAGARDLYRRIAVAAQQVCPIAIGGNLESAARAKQCQADAVTRAIGQVHEQRVVEIAAAHARRG